MTIPSTPEITILPETTDTRPEPPKMPDLWAVRSLMWLKGVMSQQQQWVAVMWTGHTSEKDAHEAAKRRIAQGDRRVQVIKIGGDA